jgi:glutaredoxin-related protein
VPSIWIRGQWIGGADDLVKLEESGELQRRLQGI